MDELRNLENALVAGQTRRNGKLGKHYTPTAMGSLSHRALETGRVVFFSS